jgi:ubiquinone/menaquinone biosynthesis C-methylase UbiE
MTKLAPAPIAVAVAVSQRAARSLFPPGRSVPFVDPADGTPLADRGQTLCNPEMDSKVAEFIPARAADGSEVPIPRFVPRGGDYAATFGWQWRKWRRTLSDAANSDTHRRKLILDRTRFSRYAIEGKTLLECGCGAGNDTEVLVTLGLAEVHSFDLASAVDEAAPLVETARRHGTRLVLSQASITAMPYPDRSFDIVYCHRVLQHTPDPEAALRAICKKVKPGGLLFVHSYQDTPWLRKHWHHRLRWLCKRLPPSLVAATISVYAPVLHRVNDLLWKKPEPGKEMSRWRKMLREVGFRYVPLIYSNGNYAHLGKHKELEIEKCITFDALTAWHEHPMTAAQFRGIIESEGFIIDHFSAGEGEPLLATARRPESPI